MSFVSCSEDGLAGLFGTVVPIVRRGREAIAEVRLKAFTLVRLAKDHTAFCGGIVANKHAVDGVKGIAVEFIRVGPITDVPRLKSPREHASDARNLLRVETGIALNPKPAGSGSHIGHRRLLTGSHQA